MGDEKPARMWLVLLGLPIGFASSLCGIGGGLFAGAWLHFGSGFDLRRSTGTALVLVLATTGAATAAELTRAEPAIDPGLWIATVVGVWVGAKLGFAFSERINDRALRAIFCVVMLVVSTRLFFSDGDAALTTGADITWPSYAVAAAVGLGGGFCSPLLGVGGGMIMVPGLFLLVSGYGFDAARATSLAAGMVGAARSLRLKSQAGRVSWRHGLLLGTGSLLGAAAGVMAIDSLRSTVVLGRLLLATLLLVLGVRFGREALRRSARS